MNILQSREVRRLLLGKLDDAIVYLLDLLLRFLHLRGWSSRLKIKKDKQTKRIINA